VPSQSGKMDRAWLLRIIIIQKLAIRGALASFMACSPPQRDDQLAYVITGLAPCKRPAKSGPRMTKTYCGKLGVWKWKRDKHQPGGRLNAPVCSSRITSKPITSKPSLPLLHYCRLDASFFTFFASFFSFGDLTATFFSVFFASWLLLMMCSVVDLTLLPEPSQFGNVGDIKIRHRALLRDSGLKRNKERKQSENA